MNFRELKKNMTEGLSAYNIDVDFVDLLNSGEAELKLGSYNPIHLVDMRIKVFGDQSVVDEVALTLPEEDSQHVDPSRSPESLVYHTQLDEFIQLKALVCDDVEKAIYGTVPATGDYLNALYSARHLTKACRQQFGLSLLLQQLSHCVDDKDMRDNLDVHGSLHPKEKAILHEFLYDVFPESSDNSKVAMGSLNMLRREAKALSDRTVSFVDMELMLKLSTGYHHPDASDSLERYEREYPAKAIALSGLNRMQDSGPVDDAQIKLYIISFNRYMGGPINSIGALASAEVHAFVDPTFMSREDNYAAKAATAARLHSLCPRVTGQENFYTLSDPTSIMREVLTKERQLTILPSIDEQDLERHSDNRLYPFYLAAWLKQQERPMGVVHVEGECDKRQFTVLGLTEVGLMEPAHATPVMIDGLVTVIGTDDPEEAMEAVKSQWLTDTGELAQDAIQQGFDSEAIAESLSYDDHKFTP